MKTLGTIFTAICVATILTQGLAVGYLAMRGQLNAKTLAGVRDVIRGESPHLSAADDDSEKPVEPSIDDVVEQRVGRVWDLDRRQKELAILKGIITARKDSVTARQDKFSKLREKVLAELKEKEDQLKNAATEKARLILAKLPPADAVANLMALDLNQNVTLLKGMQERTVAALLQQFEQSAVKAEKERGRQIFEAITRGEPQQSAIEKGLKQPPTQPTKTQPPGPPAT